MGFGKTKLERENVFLSFEKIVASHYPDRVEVMSSIYISLFKALNSRYALPNGLFTLTEYVVTITNREAIYIQKPLLLYTPLIFKLNKVLICCIDSGNCSRTIWNFP